jgi:hypothetical protein
VPANLEVAAMIITVWIDNQQSHRPLEDALISELKECFSERCPASLSWLSHLNIHPLLFLEAFVFAHEPS